MVIKITIPVVIHIQCTKYTLKVKLCLKIIKGNYASIQKKKKRLDLENVGSVWYMCLKTENCYLKIFVEICMGEKVCKNA